MASEYIDVVYPTALSVTVEIVRRLDAYRYDWDDATFKAEGWTTRKQALTEDTITLGWYASSVDPATWDDGEYLEIFEDAAILGGPIEVKGFSVVAGQFAHTGASLARAFWYENLSLIDQKTLASARAATWLGRGLRRFALLTDAKYETALTFPGVDVLYDGTTVILTLTHTNDGVTDTIRTPV